MVTILETRREACPALKLVGRRYTDADRDAGGSFAAQWGQWFQNNWFAPLQQESIAESQDSYVGAMRIAETGFEYWIGVFMAPEAPVPQGYEAVVIPAGELGVCFLYGRDGSPDLFGMEAHQACVAAWQAQGWTPEGWFLERYNCPRYTVPDEKGNVILDYCTYLSPISKE